MQESKQYVADLCFECNNCINCCPVGAVSYDGETCFSRKAKINHDKCIRCGKCERVCPSLNIQQIRSQKAEQVYAAKSVNPQEKYSSSGGIFLELALCVINGGGVVYASAYDNDLNVTTAKALTKDELSRLQGSKYVKGRIAPNTFSEIKESLLQNQTVLFCGTPCQIAALKTYFGQKIPENLLTVDLLCHGCPPQEVLQGYIHQLEEKRNAKVTGIIFRKKYFGKTVGVIEYTKRQKTRCEDLFDEESSYYHAFYSGTILNDACYTCPFAASKRISDITLCDYWGWKTRDYNKIHSLGIIDSAAVSAVFLNTEKGLQIFDRIKDKMLCVPVEYENVQAFQPNLSHPSQCDKQDRDALIQQYKESGFLAVEQWYRSVTTLRRFKKRLSYRTPMSIKKLAIRLIGLIRK